ncbi:thiol:disulfide interchange protein DsbA/DsbL [Shewanella benthica]|uniref:thiol:disulfide interchange protein DsbA/DsbL n=1 Tax=Shewanella benthica TaxID=43661 RepID=UPI00187A3944|nr:thiol:disulfide interchange protein DsbA/DsbL [Shewanella benthica]MBE7215649.1 thiol:disulfide interchange protein DsbA/DsbL [Shewanella benthica]MCL1062845.1 thiol:disulfide interchange protein DsbA/DsbL [Shewanella benthica]
MIKHIALALTLALAPLSSFAAQFEEGKHFTQIADTASAQPKLTEFFSFYCHNCYNMEKQYLGDIKANLNKKVTFDSKHVDFMNSDIGTEVMRSLAVIQELNAGDKMTHAMFAAIQGDEGAHGHNHDHDAHEKPELNNRDDIKKVFADNGFDINEYDAIADSKAVNDKIDLWRVQQRQFQIQSVPAFVVNDKYAVNMSSIRTLSELIDLINYLAVERK